MLIERLLRLRRSQLHGFSSQLLHTSLRPFPCRPGLTLFHSVYIPSPLAASWVQVFLCKVH